MENQKYAPIKFIEESIQVIYDSDQFFSKTPSCPQAFLWRDLRYSIVDLLSEWRDYRRSGRMSRNMQPQHAAVAQGRGSWGVGKFYFRVQVENGQIFDIYYDRSPKNVDNRKGLWFIYQELASKTA